MSKVSPGTMTVVLFALLIGLGGAFVVRQQLAQRIPELPQLPQSSQETTVYIPVAAVELQDGHTLAFGDIAILKFSREQLAKSAYAGRAFMKDTEQIIGRTLHTAVPKGEVFLPDLLYPEGMGPGVAERLDPGYRAVSVPIENVGAVQGFARPGSMVDVLFRSESTQERPEMTLTLLERIQVLAINTILVPNAQVELDQDLGTVTLAVTPQQAKVLKVVEGRGEISLALRNPNDDFDMMPAQFGAGMSRGPSIHGISSSSASGVEYGNFNAVLSSGKQVTLDDLLGLAPAKPTKQMKIYRGGQLEVLEFDDPQAEPNEDIIQRAGRIRTPIAHEVPTVPLQRYNTAQVEPNVTPASSKLAPVYQGQ